MASASFGLLASAVTVAASSFTMKLTDPASLLDAIDMDRVHEILGTMCKEVSFINPDYVEPGFLEPSRQRAEQAQGITGDSEEVPQGHDDALLELSAAKTSSTETMSAKVFLLGDFIDTDALVPAEIMSQPDITTEALGEYCLMHTHPHFRQCVKDGQNIVMAGEAFGCGSSREEAVPALQGAGVQCVIAKSFAFIYGRNHPNLGLLGIEMRDSKFWDQVVDGKQIRVDLVHSVVELNVNDQGTWQWFPFELHMIQRRVLKCGGAEKAFHKHGKGLWQALTASTPASKTARSSSSLSFPQLDEDAEKTKVEW